MDPEDLENKDTSPPWSGSDGSQDLDVSESYSEIDVIDSPQVLDSDPKIPEQQNRESVVEQHEYLESDTDVLYSEEDDANLSDSRESIRNSPLTQTSQTSLSSHPDCPESGYTVNQELKPQSRASSSSLGYTADMTLALTLTAKPPLGASNRHDPATGDRRSLEEGGSSEAPPASVFFGISNKFAEPAGTWYSESDTDLYRPSRHRTRYTRLNHNESQTEKHINETKSKCKRIARLLTEAPNPRNKGALLFKKRQQRVKKYTLASSFKNHQQGFNQSRSLSLPRRVNSMPSTGPLRPVMTPTQRQASCQEKVFKPPTPWEAASRNPLGSVEEAFRFQSLTSSVASNVKAAGRLRSLPEPPDEWKRRVSLDPVTVNKGPHHHTTSALQHKVLSRATETPAFFGPPFRPAQPLKPTSRTNMGSMAPDTRPTKYSPAYSAY